ncbi:hypothetical protein PV797_10040 [Clostridiaceae bacterium M8S5]|nr:hypothetical protein PV797_10040 [Clostridiaceae bacterium M8S5]
MGENRLLLGLCLNKRKKLTEEQFLREGESNGLVSAVVDALLGIVIYLGLLGLWRTLRLGHYSYTGVIQNSQNYSYLKYYNIRGLDITSGMADKITLDITIAPLGITITVLLVFIYYSVLSSKSKFLSVGELLVGCRLNAVKYKIWENYHLVNRAGLYTVAILNLIVLLDLFKGSYLGSNVYSVADIGIKFLIVFLCIFGFYGLGRGSLIGGVFLIVSNVIGYIHSSKLSYLIVDVFKGRLYFPEKSLSTMFLFILVIEIIVLIFTLVMKIKLKRRLSLLK